MKEVFKVSLLIIATAFVLPNNRALAENQRPITVGLILPLTGQTADYGVAIKNSIGLAFEQISDLKERIHLSYEDAQYDPKLAVTALTKLKNIDKADIVFVWGLAQCKTLAPIAEMQKIPLVALCLESSVAKDRKYVLRFQSSVDDYMQTTANYLQKNNLQRLAVILSETPYTEAMYEALQRQRGPKQSIQLVNRLPTSTMDFRMDVAKLRSGAFDAVGVFLSVGQVATFTKQYHEQRGELPIFGTNLFGSHSEVAAAAGNMEGSVFAEVNVKPEFLALYKKRFQNDMQIGFGALSYEFFASLGEVLRLQGVPSDPVDLLDRLANSGQHQGTAAGPYRVESSPQFGRHVSFPLTMRRIEGDKFVVLE